MEKTMNGCELEFFKIMFGDLNAVKLRIPPHFRQHIRKDLSDKATLEGPSGDRKSVKVEIEAREIYLSDGWPQFMRDNSIANNQFIVFRYEGKMHFKVKIFTPNGLERMGSAIKQLEYDLTDEKRKRGRPRKTVESEPHQVQTGRDAGKRVMRRALDLPTAEDEDSRMMFQTKIIDLEKDTNDVPRDKYLTKEETRAWMEAKSFSSASSNPCGLYWLTAKMRVMRFRIPFAQTYLPQTVTKITLRTPEGRTWKANYLPERCFLSGGWIRFARDNNICEGTICVFELVARKEFLVHIFRAH